MFPLLPRVSGAGGTGATGGSLQQQIHEWHAVPHSHTSHLRGEQLQQLSLRRPGDLGEQIAGGPSCLARDCLRADFFFFSINVYFLVGV